MSNVVWLGIWLLFGTCLAYSQNPSILVPSGSNSPNILSFNINTKKYVHTVSDHFLSFTLEPSAIFSELQNNHGLKTVINMAKGLNPAYIRISGPECNYFKFQGSQDTSQSSPIYPIKQGRNITITGWHWSQLNEFVKKTGLDLIVGLNIMNRQHGSWDLSNAVDLISYSDKHDYNMAFQLGNDISAIASRIDGSTLGKDATRLRKVLEAFPRYFNSPIISPDIKSCDSQEEARYLKNFISESSSSLSAITYQVPFASEKNVENPTEIFSYIQNQLEARLWQKDLLNKYLGKIGVKKPLWIVESGNKDRRGDFMDGLIWAQRLCAGARTGINVMLRKPSQLSLHEPTPDYWVSVIYKALVGSEVLDIKISSGNKTCLETVAHCTKMLSHNPNEGIIAPELYYNRGAVTIFGVNMGSENAKISLKIGQKEKLSVHQYFLTGNNKQHGKRSTLFNGQKLMLSPDGELPIISPKIRGSHQLITIPSQSVFLLVLPEAKSKACTAVQLEEFKESFKNGGKVVDQEEFDEFEYDTPVLDQEDEMLPNEKNTYVSFRPKYMKNNDEYVAQKNERQEELKIDINEMNQFNKEGTRSNDNLLNSEPVVKYVTFSNNNWLSKFPKSLHNKALFVEPSTFPPTESTSLEMQTEKSLPLSTPQSRREKYFILAQAVAGKRHPEKNIKSESYLNSDSTFKPFSQKLKIMKRSIVDSNLSSKEVKEMIEDFTNKKEQSLYPVLKKEESSAVNDTILELNKDDVEILERSKKEVIGMNFVTLDTQLSTLTSQTTQQSMISSTPTPSTVKQPIKLESYIQKIKSRKEQALAKMNEKFSHKTNRRKSQGSFKEETNSAVQGSTIEKSVTSTEAIIAKKEPEAVENTNNLIENLRYNRQTNNKTTDGNLKIIRPRINLKPKKSEKITSSGSSKSVISSTSETNHIKSSTTEIPTSKIKHKNFPKRLMLSKSKDMEKAELQNGNNETAQQSGSHFDHNSVLHLGKVKTVPNVDMAQIATNVKVTDRLIENLRDGRKSLQSRHIVSPMQKIEENKQEVKNSSMADTKIKTAEEKYKVLRSEIERKFHERFHKVNKRSLENDITDDDVMGKKNILKSDKIRSNELNVDLGYILKREVVRYPRAVADFTLKLNEVNAYLDKNKNKLDQLDSKKNEIIEDVNIADTTNKENTNDLHLSAEDTETYSEKNKLKRKSVFEEFDNNFNYNSENLATKMMNRLFNHMKKLWNYLKKSFQF